MMFEIAEETYREDPRKALFGVSSKGWDGDSFSLYANMAHPKWKAVNAMT
jgi:hypothetical protein